jgi:hypothetical protein
MAADLDQVNTKTAKQVQSEALGKGLWRALWIAIAICLVWLVIEGRLSSLSPPSATGWQGSRVRGSTS